MFIEGRDGGANGYHGTPNGRGGGGTGSTKPTQDQLYKALKIAVRAIEAQPHEKWCETQWLGLPEPQPCYCWKDETLSQILPIYKEMEK